MSEKPSQRIKEGVKNIRKDPCGSVAELTGAPDLGDVRREMDALHERIETHADTFIPIIKRLEALEQAHERQLLINIDVIKAFGGWSKYDALVNGEPKQEPKYKHSTLTHSVDKDWLTVKPRVCEHDHGLSWRCPVNSGIVRDGESIYFKKDFTSCPFCPKPEKQKKLEETIADIPGGGYKMIAEITVQEVKRVIDDLKQQPNWSYAGAFADKLIEVLRKVLL